MKQKKRVRRHSCSLAFISELFRNDDVEKELIDHFEEYFPYFMEYHEVISDTRVFASAIQDFYFNGNVSLGLLKNITEVSSRMNTRIMFDNEIIPSGVE